MNSIKLTQTVQKGGCAAKVAAAELKVILQQVKFPPTRPDLIVDGSTMDDAAVIRVNADLGLVQTLDFFTPIVDDPYLFGQIAAANSLSDVYAMGGAPQTAMAILAFPLATMDSSVIVKVLQGASDKIKEAESLFVGGHSIDDDTLKFGLSVTGYVSPQNIWTNAHARPGDRVILIKPLGTGTATAALKRQAVAESEIQDALKSMAQLNRIRHLLSDSQWQSIHAATDITGFGLAGHVQQMAIASQVSFEIQFQNIPVFPNTMAFLEKGFLTKAHRTNREYTEKNIQFSRPTSDIEKMVLFDPQTSGGLLLCVDAHEASGVLKSIQSDFLMAREIGQVSAESNHRIVIQ